MDLDTKLTCRAVIEDWEVPKELQTRCVERLAEALEVADNPRDIARITTALAKLKGQDIQLRTSQAYIDAVGEEGTRARIMKPWEVATIITASVVGEYTANGKDTTTEQQPAPSTGQQPAPSTGQQPAPSTGHAAMKESPSCPALAGPDPTHGAFGAGVW